MKLYSVLPVLLLSIAVSCATPPEGASSAEPSQSETVFTYSLPCKVVNLNQDKPGKSLLCIWLHGGVHDRKLHNLLKVNHLDMAEADDKIVDYLRRSGEKAVVLMPLCYKAIDPECTEWAKCFIEVKAMIDEYVGQGLVDERRIYLTGASDGGTGTWDYAEAHGELFAAAMPMSCGRPRMTDIPVYFFNTGDESDCTEKVAALNEKGCHITYKYGASYKHGGDSEECTDELLSLFFSHRRR